MQLNKETVELDNLIRNINKLLNNYTKNQLVNTDLTLPRFYALWYISQMEPVNMGELNKKIMVANSSLTITVDHLVKEGFVKRYRNDIDRRVVLLESTDKGKKQIENLLNKRQEFFQQSLENINLNEQQLIIRVLENIMNNLIIKNKK